MSPIIRVENATDQASIRNVNQLAFGRNDEADLVDALRVAVTPQCHSSPIWTARLSATSSSAIWRS